jgi:hypothetical protein
LNAEPPRIVVEQPAPCSDIARAEEALKRALSPARAPNGKWTVSLRVERAPGKTLRGEAEITDQEGTSVAARTIDTGSTECTSLARGVGVWASLVLDDEVRRAAAESPPPAPAPTPPPETSASPTMGWHGAAHGDHPSSPDAELFLAHPQDQERTFEIGVATHLITGTGVGGIAGASIFFVSEVGDGWFLRPSLGFGRTTTELAPSSDVYATLGAGRFDACKRLPGNYLEKRGMQLDMCGGADLGFMHFDAPTAGAGLTTPVGQARTTPFFAVGPSLALRGEMGSDLAVTIRGVAELNLIRESFIDGAGTSVDPSLIIGRAEVGLSWRLR